MVCALVLRGLSYPATDYLSRRFGYPDSVWTNTWNMGGDLSRLAEGDWVEFAWTWSVAGRSAQGVTKLSCVRATPEEVWIEIAESDSWGRVELVRVNRRTREVVGAWQDKPWRSPAPMTIYSGSPPDTGPAPVLNGTVRDASGECSMVEVPLGGRLLKAEKVTLSAVVEGPLRRTERCTAEIVTSDAVPFPLPPGGDSRRGEPEHVVGLCAAGVPWTTAPGLSGGVVSFRVSNGTSSAPGRWDPPVVETRTLRAFGRDARPTVHVSGETGP
ncbi:MAG: hypothetical protein IT452_23750 [Planctomycetia bacterium]|nr:hypothetical protein [Planctomycetia bacterium]